MDISRVIVGSLERGWLLRFSGGWRHCIEGEGGADLEYLGAS